MPNRPAQTVTIHTGRTSVTPAKLKPTPRIPVPASKFRVAIREKPARGRAWPVAD